MESILLVEPDYKNKYPPIGLMKISTYHKGKGDHVEFYKGKPPYNSIINADRIYITSLFTFYFDEVVEVIDHIRKFYPDDRIHLGGIVATIMHSRFREMYPRICIESGQLTSSSKIGYDDDVNIDSLPLDYDILDDIDYRYPASGNFFAYTTRGCCNKCKFCAVPLLEPEFYETNNLIEQITYTRELYGDMRNILLMDNNILCSGELTKIVQDLNRLGFVKNQKTYVKPNPITIALMKMDRRVNTGYSIVHILDDVKQDIASINRKNVSRDLIHQFNDIAYSIDNADCKQSYSLLKENKTFLEDIFDRYKRRLPCPRFVDFNQGIDARQITDDNMNILSMLPLKPFRLAYDNYKYKEVYEKAFYIAYEHGIRDYSNYLLYNYEERPEELWMRMEHNIRLHMECGDTHLFSFPMRYAPIDRTDRNYVGKYWTKKQLSAMNEILNVTKGVVMMEDDFFYKAFGHSTEEFLEILSMPSEFIKYRSFFEDNGKIEDWRNEYDLLSGEQRTVLLNHLSKPKKDWTLCEEMDWQLSNIEKYYHITKESMSKNRVA